MGRGGEEGVRGAGIGRQRRVTEEGEKAGGKDKEGMERVKEEGRVRNRWTEEG